MGGVGGEHRIKALFGPIGWHPHIEGDRHQDLGARGQARAPLQGDALAEARQVGGQLTGLPSQSGHGLGKKHGVLTAARPHLEHLGRWRQPILQNGQDGFFVALASGRKQHGLGGGPNDPVLEIHALAKLGAEMAGCRGHRVWITTAGMGGGHHLH